MQEMQAAGASSAPLAFINMLKSMLGLGLFTMPFLTAKGGLVLASVVLCLAGGAHATPRRRQGRQSRQQLGSKAQGIDKRRRPRFCSEVCV